MDGSCSLYLRLKRTSSYKLIIELTYGDKMIGGREEDIPDVVTV